MATEFKGIAGVNEQFFRRPGRHQGRGSYEVSAMSLKPGRKIVKFGDIAENIAVRVSPSVADTEIYVGLEHLDPESLHLRQWGHPSDVEGDKLRFWKGDIIFGRRRAYQRKLAVAEFDGICSAH